MTVAPKIAPLLREEPDDATLVGRARAGDRWAEEALYRRHVHAVTNTVVRLLGSRQDAEDIVQDTFVGALEALSTLRDPSALRPWLVSIAIRQVRTRFRKLRLMRALGLVPRGDVSLESLAKREILPDQRAELALLDTALEALSFDLRSAWVLRHVEGYELTEAAALCGCSLATIKRRVSAADDRVTAHLQRERGRHV